MMCTALSGRGTESGAGRQPEVIAKVVLLDIDFAMCTALSGRGAESGAGRQPESGHRATGAGGRATGRN